MNSWGDPISQFIHWFKTRPILAKTYIVSCLVVAVLLEFSVFTYMDMYYTFEKIYVAAELWRVVSCFFYLGGVQFSLIIEAYFAYLILFNTESITFGKEKLADYIMAIIFNATILLIISSCYDLYFLNDAFLFALLYVSSKFKPFLKIRLLLDIDLSAKWFVWVYAAFNILMGTPISHFIAGFIVGYLYFKVKTTLTWEYVDLWPTPSLLKKMVNIYVDWSEKRDIQMLEEPEDDDYESYYE